MVHKQALLPLLCIHIALNFLSSQFHLQLFFLLLLYLLLVVTCCSILFNHPYTFNFISNFFPFAALLYQSSIICYVWSCLCLGQCNNIILPQSLYLSTHLILFLSIDVNPFSNY